MADKNKTKAQLINELTNLRQQLNQLNAKTKKYEQMANDQNVQLVQERKNAQIFDQAQQEIANNVQALKTERDFASTVLETAGVLVMALDPTGKILRFNRACENTTGYTFNEVYQKFYWTMFLNSTNAKSAKKYFEQTLTYGVATSYESCWLTKQGEKRYIIWSDTTSRNEKGDVEHVISVGNDITERKQLEERLLAIHQLGGELTLLRDEKAILKFALETAAFLLQYKSAGYGLVSEINHNLDYYYYPIRGVSNELRLKAPLDKSKRFNLLEQQGHLTISIQRITAKSHSINPQEKKHLWLTAHMQIGDTFIGVLDIEGNHTNSFTVKDQQLLQTLADQTAVAIQNARLHLETQYRVDELTTMTLISQAITSTLNLEESLTIITDHTVRLLNVMAVSVALKDKTQGRICFRATPSKRARVISGERLFKGQEIVNWVIEYEQPVIVPDISKDPRFSNMVDRQTHSAICVPLQSRKQTIGAIEAINKRNGSFVQEDLRLLNWLATPASIAIENARLFEAEHQARQQAEILREATAPLTSSLNMVQVLNSILIHLEKVILYDNAYIYLRNNDWLKVVAQSNASEFENHQSNKRYPANNPLYQQIESTSHPVILSNAQNDTHFELWNTDKQITGWMGVPLMVRNKVIGCLTLESQQIAAYGLTEASLAQALANQAAVAIQNAQLFEQVHISHKQLQSLSRRLVEVQESERRHIARELHDEAGQALTSLMLGLRLLERNAHQPNTVMQQVQELKLTTNNIIENLHRLAINLRPASLDHVGLIAALRQYIDAFSRQHNLAMQFEIVGLEDKRLPPNVETNLYRIVQETLTNVIKHAQATRVDVLIEKRGEQIVFIVEDNGIGFTPESANQSDRLGLLGMKERAEMLGGTLEIESTLNLGTTIYVEIPYAYPNTNS